MEGAIHTPILAFLEVWQWILVLVLIGLIVFLKVYRNRQA